MTLDYPSLAASFVDYNDPDNRQKTTVWAFKLVTRGVDATEFDFGTGSFGYGDFCQDGDEIIGGRSSFKAISSIAVDSVQYIQMSSIANTILTEESFFYDINTTIIYIHFSGGYPPGCFGTISLGLSSAYSSQSIKLGKTTYEERISDVSTINKNKDPLSFGKLAFTTGNVSLINTDGYFDSLSPEFIFGQKVVISLLSPDMGLADAHKVFTGFVESYSINTDVFQVSFTDDRKKLQKSVPIDHFDLVRWPLLSDKSVDKPIPIAYGVINNAPVICVNEAENWQTPVYTRWTGNSAPSGGTPATSGGYTFITGDRIIWNAGTGHNHHIYEMVASVWQDKGVPINGMTVYSTFETYQLRYVESTTSWDVVPTDDYPNTYQFKVCDTTNWPMTSLSKVYVNDEEVAFTDVSLVDGTFNIAVADFIGSKRVMCDFVGADLYNSIDILQNILNLYFDISYTSDTFDTVEWEIARGLAYDINLYLDKDTPAINIIELISTSNFGSFVVKNDGTYSFKVYDPTTANVYRINRDEQLEVPEVSYDSQQFATQVLIQYDKDYASNKYKTYLDNTRAYDILLNYGTEQQKTYTTCLVNRDDAIDLASRIMDVAEYVPRIYKTKMKMQASDYEISDNMIVQSDRTASTRYGLAKAETIGISYDLNNFETTLTHRYIEDYTEPSIKTIGTWTRDYPHIPNRIQ